MDQAVMERNDKIIKFKKGQYAKAKTLISALEKNPLWGREIVLFKRLMEKYPFEYLLSITRPVDSLLWFFTPEGEKYLTNLKYNVLYKPIPKPNMIALSENSFGENFVTRKRLPVKIKDFLK
jgi:hypothetical protein